MTEHVIISVGAVRDRDSGNVFCAAVLRHKDNLARINDILPGANGYTSSSGGLALITAKALFKLQKKCSVSVEMGCQTKEFLACLDVASGLKKGKKGSIEDGNKQAFESLVQAINTHVEAGNIQFAWKLNDSFCYEVSEMASTFRDTWKEHLSEPEISPEQIAIVENSLGRR